jgi:hypothetical protein
MNYCTYFDKNYLSRGLALYNSLLKNHKAKFHLYIVAIDQFTYDFLKKKNFKFITCIYVADFENKELQKVKKKDHRLSTCGPAPLVLYFFLFKNTN